MSKKRYRYTGRERDEETGLSYHGARYYAPWLGRWCSADPAGMVDGPNRYQYVRGNPVGGRDPTGLATQDDRVQVYDRTDPVLVTGGPVPEDVAAQVEAELQQEAAGAGGSSGLSASQSSTWPTIFDYFPGLLPEGMTTGQASMSPGALGNVARMLTPVTVALSIESHDDPDHDAKVAFVGVSLGLEFASVPGRPPSPAAQGVLRHNTLPATGERARLFARTTETGTNQLPAGSGFTDKFGNVTYSTLGSADDIALARYHESVHSFLSPKLTLFRELRADLGAAAYQNIATLRYIEEALAESYAQMRVYGISALPAGIKFPVREGYVTLTQLAVEGAVGTVAVGGVTYYVVYSAE